MNQLGARIGALTDRLGARRLLWFARRGADAEALDVLPQLDASFSMVAALRSSRMDAARSVAFEDLRKRRVDLNTYDITTDPDHDGQVARFHGLLVDRLRDGDAVLPFSASPFLTEAMTSPGAAAELLAMPYALQSSFENKRWVETSLCEVGVETVGWRSVPPGDLASVCADAGGAVVLRSGDHSGGVGMVLVEDPEQARQSLLSTSADAVAVSTFIPDALPLNVGACAFPDGSVVRHPVSVQLVGVPELTRRRFAYAGNDFGRVADLDDHVLDEIDAMVVTVGRWVIEHGYVGAFGVDLLVTEGRPLLTEVNPRFQGSTFQGARLARAFEVPDLYLDHLAAVMGMEPARSLTIRQWARLQHDAPCSYVYVFGGASPVRLREESLAHQVTTDRDVELRCLAGRDIVVQADAGLFQMVTQTSVTETGYDLAPECAASIATLRTAFEPLRT